MKPRKLIMAMMGVSALALAMPVQAADNERGHWSRSDGQERSNNGWRGGGGDRGNAVRARPDNAPSRAERPAPQARIEREVRPERVERPEPRREISPIRQQIERNVRADNSNDNKLRDIKRAYQERAEQAQRNERRDWSDRDRNDRNRDDWRDRNDGRNWDRNDRNDRREWNDRNRSDWRRDNDRDRHNWDRKSNSWNRDWRRDQRYDWQRYRTQYRHIYHAPRYYAPYGWNYGYRPFSIGITLFSGLYGSRYWIDNPSYYRLPPAYGSLRWVRYYDDALLVDIDTGYVVDVIRDFFW